MVVVAVVVVWRKGGSSEQGRALGSLGASCMLMVVCHAVATAYCPEFRCFSLRFFVLALIPLAAFGPK